MRTMLLHRIHFINRILRRVLGSGEYRTLFLIIQLFNNSKRNFRSSPNERIPCPCCTHLVYSPYTFDRSNRHQYSKSKAAVYSFAYNLVYLFWFNFILRNILFSREKIKTKRGLSLEIIVFFLSLQREKNIEVI